jgi:hypothetical protein
LSKAGSTIHPCRPENTSNPNPIPASILLLETCPQAIIRPIHRAR